MTRPRAVWTPPMRDGLSASRVSVTAGPWVTLAEFLAARLPAANDWPERIARGDVLDAEGRLFAADAPATPGMLAWYWRSPPPEARVPFEIDILHRDDELVVVDKPHFLPVNPGGRHVQETVLVRLNRLLGITTLTAVHRLDLETAGVMLFCVQAASRNAYHAMLRERRMHKVYEAIAPWRPELALPMTLHHRLEEHPNSFMQMQVVSGEPNARTRVELIGPAGLAGLAHYRLTPITGRKHQLRAQMNAIGLPIVGDRIYPRLWPEPAVGAARDYSQPLQLLAREVAFTDPVSGEPRRFISRRRLERLDVA